MNKFEFKNLTPFKWFVLENFPFIEADFDALTDWQLFCKLGKEINKIINSTNTLGTQVESLTDYVSNYFENLNIQDEVNKKLDEMAESGQLSEIIAQYLNLKGVLAFDTLQDLINADNIVNGSIARTLGTNTYNDGKGYFYKIRTITSSDVVDNINIIKLNISDTLIAEKIIDLSISILNNKTFYFTPEMYGAKGDGVTDDYLAFEKMINEIKNIVPIVNFTNEVSCKDFSHISIKFTQKYVVSKPVIFANTYGLTIENLHLIASNTFEGDSLFILSNVSRETNILNCIFNGNLSVNNCFTLQDYSLITRINNCQFTRFKKYGFYGTSKGHEILMNNCKINQVEYGEIDTDIFKNLVEGVGMFLDTERYDNHFTNLVINYCKNNTLSIKSGSNWFNTCHFYRGNVNCEGAYNYFNNCYFDGVVIKLAGFNYIKGCFIKGDLDHFIEITESFDNNWKYQCTYFCDNILRNDIKQTETPIIFTGSNWSGNENQFGLQCVNNTFYQVKTFNYQAPAVYMPDPWKILKYTGSSDEGTVRIGNFLIEWGLISQSDYVNFPIVFDEYTIAVLILPLANSDSIPYPSDISKSRFYANGIHVNCKWIAIGRMYE